MGGPMPISFADIEAYCRLKGIYSLGDRERLLSLLDPLDRAWMAHAHAEAERKGSGKPPPPTHSPPRDRATSNRRTQQV